jgi:hypothetical protein
MQKVLHLEDKGQEGTGQQVLWNRLVEVADSTPAIIAVPQAKEEIEGFIIVPHAQEEIEGRMGMDGQHE